MSIWRLYSDDINLKELNLIWKVFISTEKLIHYLKPILYKKTLYIKNTQIRLKQSDVTNENFAWLNNYIHRKLWGEIDYPRCRYPFLAHNSSIWTTVSQMASSCPGSAFIKPDQRNPWIKDQIKITLLPTISHLLLPNFVSCGRACPSHMTQNLVTVGAKLWTADRFIVDPWSMDYADPVW